MVPLQCVTECKSNVTRSIVFWNKVPGATRLQKHDWTQENQVKIFMFFDKKQPPSMQKYHENWCSTNRGQLLVDPWMNRISWYFRCWALTALRNPHPCVLFFFYWSFYGLLLYRCNWEICWDKRGYDFISDQIVATSHDLTPKGSWGREISLFQENLGWCNIIIWPVIRFTWL